MGFFAAKSDSTTRSTSRTDTIIGAGVRVDGNITFTGVLHIQGNVRGNVSCDDSGNGTTIIGKSGSITGDVTAPNIVIGGRIDGPVQSSESVQIQRGGCVAGDVAYKDLAVHAGGVIEGSLIPRVLLDRRQPRQGRRSSVSEKTASNAPVQPSVAASAADSTGALHTGRWLKLGVVAALLIAVAAVVLVNRGQTPVEVEPRTASTTDKEAAAAPASALPPDAAKTTADAAPPPPAPQPSPVAPAATVTPRPAETIKSAVTVAPVEAPAADIGKVVTVQGIDPDKSAGVVYVSSEEPSVLIKKKRQDAGEGTRIELSHGGKKSISISGNDLLRVAEGRKVIIFYQGRKVAPQAIDSSAWMRFVPLSSGGGGEEK